MVLESLLEDELLERLEKYHRAHPPGKLLHRPNQKGEESRKKP